MVKEKAPATPHFIERENNNTGRGETSVRVPRFYTVREGLLMDFSNGCCLCKFVNLGPPPAHYVPFPVASISPFSFLLFSWLVGWPKFPPPSHSFAHLMQRAQAGVVLRISSAPHFFLRSSGDLKPLLLGGLAKILSCSLSLKALTTAR